MCCLCFQATEKFCSLLIALQFETVMVGKHNVNDFGSFKCVEVGFMDMEMIHLGR